MTACPRCGASNPTNNKFCGNCGQVLLADTPPIAGADNDLPPWLRDTGDESSTAARPTEPLPAASSESSNELPAWLSDIGVEDEAPQADRGATTPDWLAQLQQTAPTEPAAHDDLPAWLRQDEASAPPNHRDAATPESGSDPLPDWLSGIGSEFSTQSTQPPASAQASDDLPAWLTAPEPVPATNTDVSQPAADTSFGWLNELDQPAAFDPAPHAAAPMPESQANELPSWLTDDTSPPVSSSTQADTSADALPSWLTSDEPFTLDHESFAASPAESTSSAAHADSDIPAWLRDDQALPAASTPAAPTTSDELPDWLRSDESAPAPPAPSGNALPDWLNSDESANGVAPATTANGEELPSWLSGDQADTPFAPATTASSEELPSWLSGDESHAQVFAPPTANTEELPDWLRDDQAMPATSAASMSSTESPDWLRDDASTDAGDLSVPVPDWSSEFGAPEPASASALGAQLPAWLNDSDSSATQDAPSSHPSSDVPAWLSDGDSTASSSVTSQSAQTGGDLPAWLMEESPTAPQFGATGSGGASDPSFAGQDADHGLPAWLADASPASQPVASSADEGLPSWLADTGGPVAEPVTHDSSPMVDVGATQALPAWLLDESPSGLGSAAPAMPPAASDEGLPSWLQSVDETAAPPPVEGIPDWLALPDDAGSASHVAQVYDTPADNQTPSWLADSSDTSAASAPPAPSTGEADLPAWLSESNEAADEPGAAKIYESSAPAPSGGNTVQLPSWLDDAPASPNTSGVSDSTSAAGLPSWLDGMETEAPPPPPSGSTLPSWLDEPTDQAAPAASPDAPQSELLGGLDLPAWLRAESEPQPVQQPTPEAAPEWLQRIAPETEDAPSAVAPVDVPPQPRIVRSQERVAAMHLLDQMMVEPVPEPMPEPAPARRSWLMPVLIGLVLLLLIAALVTILLNPRFGFNFGAAPAGSPVAGAVAQLIARLPAGRPVVLAYEWDAQRLGDIRPLEEAVVGQLVSRNDVPLILLSTDPQGALLAEERATQILSVKDNFHDQYGLGLVNLGFKAGGPVALRRFGSNESFGGVFAQDAYGRDLREFPATMQSMCGDATADRCSWENVSLLVVMADEVEDVRGWFEQVRSSHPNLETLLLTPTEIAPQAQPYAATNNARLLAGLSSAEAFVRARGGDTERLGRQVDATAAGSVLFAGLVLIGAVPALITGRRQRRDTKGDVWEQ